MALAALICAAPGSVTAHLDAPPKLFAPIKSGILREWPSVVFVAEAGAAELGLVVRAERGELVLTVSEAGRVLETRRLGKAQDAAVRLAVLLTLRRIQERAEREPHARAIARTSSSTIAGALSGAETATAARDRAAIASIAARANAGAKGANNSGAAGANNSGAAGADNSGAAGINGDSAGANRASADAAIAPGEITADVAATPPPRRAPVVAAEIETSTPSTPARYELDAAATLVGWTAPAAIRPGVTAAVLRRFGPAAIGARASASGLCCTIRGNGMQVDATSAALFLEARLRTELGPLGLEAAAALGPTFDALRAEATLFDGGPENFHAFTLGGRATLSADFPLTDALSLAASAGISWFAQNISARLPVPVAPEVPPAERGRLLPTFELGLRALDL